MDFSRSRLLDEGMRPDSPSGHRITDSPSHPDPSIDNSLRSRSARCIDEDDLPDDDCDNHQNVVSGAACNEMDIEDVADFDRPSSQSDILNSVDESRNVAGPSQGYLDEDVDGPVSESQSVTHRYVFP